MPRYKITKYVEAKNIKQALKREAQTEADEIVKEEPEPKEIPNTHAIGFHIPYQPDLESYNPSP